MKIKDYADIKRRVWKRYIDNLCLSEEDNIVVFGCGEISGQLLQYLPESYKSKIQCLCDNNQKLWGSNREEYLILSPKEAATKYPGAVFVIAIARNSDDIKAQLTEYGISEESIRAVNIFAEGEESRDYLEERLGEKYVMDRSYPSEAAIPVIKHRNRNDKRDFRIYVEEGLTKWFTANGDVLKEDLMNLYEKNYGKYISTSDLTISGGDTKARVMVVCSHKDYKQKTGNDSNIYVPIQVGKALTDIKMYELTDDTGNNISDRNYNYCECSALYWAWKNKYAVACDYLGLRHYRRRLDITDEQICSLKANGVDIVHLDPIYHDNIRFSFVNHTKNDNDWDVMKDAIKERFPDYYDSMLEYENQHFVCGYNMAIYKRDVFDDYCEFLFGVLTGVEDYYLKICDRRDRYLGFLAENLFGVYLIKNRDKYKSVVAKLVPQINV